MAEIIQLRRLRVVATQALAERFQRCDKAPKKELELRSCRPDSHVAERARDAVGDLGRWKAAAARRGRGMKMRLFRVFKLVGSLKSSSAPAPCRPLGSRLRVKGRMLRL